MKKRLSTIVMSLLLGLVLLASPVSNAFAQNKTPQLTAW